MASWTKPVQAYLQYKTNKFLCYIIAENGSDIA